MEALDLEAIMSTWPKVSVEEMLRAVEMASDDRMALRLALIGFLQHFPLEGTDTMAEGVAKAAEALVAESFDALQSRVRALESEMELLLDDMKKLKAGAKPAAPKKTTPKAKK